MSESDALFLTSNVNIQYLTGFSGLSPSEREAYLLVIQDTWHLFTFQLYRDEAEQAAKKHKQIQIHFITPEKRMSQLLVDIVRNNPLTHLRIESHSITHREYEDIKQAIPGVAIVTDNGSIELQRIKKTSEEIALLKKATEITDDCFSHIQQLIKKDITEAEIAWQIERYIREHGAKISFDPIVAFNANASIPHHVSSSTNTLQDPSVILLDFGAKIQGYHADMTRILFFGTPKPAWVKAYNALLQSQEAALSFLISGTSGAKADEICRKLLTEHGYPVYPHSLGHGVGLEIHENPRLSIFRDYQIEEGMVFSVEPGIYISGEFGMRIEDLVLKTKDGIEVLSKASKKIIVIGS